MEFLTNLILTDITVKNKIDSSTAIPITLLIIIMTAVANLYWSAGTFSATTNTKMDILQENNRERKAEIDNLKDDLYTKLDQMSNKINNINLIMVKFAERNNIDVPTNLSSINNSITSL